MDFASALSIAKDSRGSNETAYREALEYLIDHRDELKSRVFVLLPGGMTSNTDPTWNKVRENTDSRCGCGNERTLMPLNTREKYEPGETLKVGYKDQIHIRPKGSDKESCVVRVEVVCFQDGPEGSPAPSPEAPATEAPAAEAPAAEAPAAAPEPRTYGLHLVQDPFGPVGINAFLDLLAPKAYKLDGIAKNMPDGGMHLTFVKDGRKLPILNITEIDPIKPEITIVLDADMEVFDPSTEPDRHHVQMALVTIGGPDSEQSSPPQAEAQAADSAATPIQTE